jgi:adenosylhomocysteine nucleosidase
LLRRLPPSLRRTLTVRTVGPRAARLDRLDLPHGPQPSALLVTGLAGGCEPGLAPGDVILGDPVAVAGPPRREVEPDPELRRRAVRALDAAGLRYRTGRLLTVDEVVTGPAEKARWWRSDGAAAVDMESAHVLDWARRAGLPALAVRVVADGPGDEVPAALLGVGAGTVARLLARPALLAPAWRLGRRSGRALESLGRFMRAFLDTPGEP